MGQMAKMPQNVIVAVSTGRQSAAIAGIRLSGGGCHRMVATHCLDIRDPVEFKRMILTWLADPATGQMLDHAMVVFFAKGASYTGEETAEIFCHGGPRVVDQIVDSLVRAGARRAEPGEFTRRAVANGRMDLIQAEAVSLLTSAGTGAAVSAALNGVSGRPSAEVSAVREDLLDILAECEASLDFDEEDGVFADLSVVRPGLDGVANKLSGWLDSARALRPAISGVRVALVGPPNAGKSSLFNALLGKERAIVDPEPGTTRDVVTDGLVLSGVNVMLVDTAGIREAEGRVEAVGVMMAQESARSADLVLAVSDGRKRDFDSGGIVADVRVLTKADLWAGPATDVQGGPSASDVREIAVSVVDGRGLAALRALIADRAVRLTSTPVAGADVIVGERQVAEVERTADHVGRAVSYLCEGAPLEVVALEIRGAVQALGSVTGAVVTEEILDRIFTRFCVGK